METKTPGRCDRCGDKTGVITGSYFDTSLICPRCNQVERAHPDFRRALDTENTHVRAGNYNYQGVGLPPDLLELCQQARRDAHTQTDSDALN